jgi:hypothetical protein
MNQQSMPSAEQPLRLALNSLLSSITRPQMRERLPTINVDRPDIRMVPLMLGSERMLEYSLGICTDESLRAAAPPVHPIEAASADDGYDG